MHNSVRRVARMDEDIRMDEDYDDLDIVTLLQSCTHSMHA